MSNGFSAEQLASLRSKLDELEQVVLAQLASKRLPVTDGQPPRRASVMNASGTRTQSDSFVGSLIARLFGPRR